MGCQLLHIGDSAFQRTGLTTAALPLSLTSLAAKAFAETKLTSIVIPANVTTMGDGVFDECPHLREVVIQSGSKLTHLSLDSFGKMPAHWTLDFTTRAQRDKFGPCIRFGLVNCSTNNHQCSTT